MVRKKSRQRRSEARAKATEYRHSNGTACVRAGPVAYLCAKYIRASMAYTANLTAHKADLYGKHGTFSYADQNIAPVLSLLDLKSGERVLDIGCGDGHLTDKLAHIVGENGLVIGTDSNAGMVSLSIHPHFTRDLWPVLRLTVIYPTAILS